MNENLNLEKILKHCPKGTKLYSPVLGEVDFLAINYFDRTCPIMVKAEDGTFCFTQQGKLYDIKQSECLLFPSKDQRNWSKFGTPQCKKERFDPKALQPFDKVLTRDTNTARWRCGLFSHIINEGIVPTYQCVGTWYKFCIPYNNDTKHLVGTNEEAPEYYRYWED